MKNKIQRIILYQWFSTGVPRDRLCVPRKISNICNYAGKNIENSTLFHYICAAKNYDVCREPKMFQNHCHRVNSMIV